ncbi:PilN domain-containing protein [Psychrobacter sanguinis]|uniref:PilN domain-containing protein n=1 Tax=Psychrobacter sanguinis TaxID=861445 RepID=UPI001917CC1D|nr:PilN domain-containing protein [Psychrobacter sanguinis]MCC3308603.1 PilN domain-containing protein [Psychrobacter sanguinis]UEC25893.1 PilN domain-containing protein [Psychrobacter sanguinis]
MAAINLLPWRERHRQHKNRQFTIALTLSFVLSIVGAAAVWGYLYQSKINLISANQYLIENNTLLEAALQHDQLMKQRREKTLAQSKHVEKLANYQMELVQLWSDLATVIPTSLYLTDFRREQASIMLRGSTIESSQVSKLDSYLQQNKSLQQAQIKFIKTVESGAHSVSNQKGNDQDAINHTGAANPNRYLQFEIVATMSESEAKDTYSAQTAITELDLKNEVGQ